ncbi:MAG: GcrA family cell cycle regulator [Janthinobacterium lividum]
MDWTDAVILSLRALWDEGLSTAEIGRRLGVTKNAVVGKAHRLVLPARPSPIRRGAPVAVAARRATGPTLPSMELPEPAERPANPGVVAVVVQADAGAKAREAVVTPSVVQAVPVQVVAVAQPVEADDEDVVEPAVRPAVVRAVPSLRPVASPRRLRVVACCWPIGEPGTRSFRFCDAESMAGKPYCDSHAQLAYVKVRDRREDAA